MPGFVRSSLPLLIAVAISRGAAAQTPAAEPSIIPRPAKLTTHSGRFLLTGRTVNWVSSDASIVSALSVNA